MEGDGLGKAEWSNEVMKKHAAVFLDRDGTINEEVGYMDSLEKLKIIPEAFAAIRRINQNDMKAVVITNQSGVARGFFSEDFVQTVHAIIQEQLKARKAFIDAFYFCPHHPTEGQGVYLQTCNCRKPAPGLLFKAADEMEIDLGRSYLIGDMPKDIEAAKRAGAKGILVRTGYGQEHRAFAVEPDYIAGNILDAVRWILKDKDK
ncbi:MAG: HAD family hydrolase [Deltaproteobacteria bacterium]|nr:HAD family hydrolase [Deltaproteobacteria bacterium]